MFLKKTALKFRGFFRLYRFDVPVIVFLGTVAGRMLTTGFNFHVILEALFLSLFPYNFVYTLNSITDKFEDSINKPWRPLPDGTLSNKEAVYWLIFITFISAAGIPVLFSGIEIFLAYLVIFLGISYSLPPLTLKKHLYIAPLVTGWGVAHPLYITGGMKLFWVTSSLMLHAFGTTFLKDLSDIKGDKLAGRSVVTDYFGLKKIVSVSITLMSMSIVAFIFTNYPFIGIIPAVSIIVVLYLFNKKRAVFVDIVYKRVVWATAISSAFIVVLLSFR